MSDSHNEYYIKTTDGSSGPYTFTQLKEFVENDDVLENTLISFESLPKKWNRRTGKWEKGEEVWVEAKTIPGLTFIEKIYIKTNDGHSGPYTFSQLSQFVENEDILNNSLISIGNPEKKGSIEWVEAKTIPGLSFPLFTIARYVGIILIPCDQCQRKFVVDSDSVQEHFCIPCCDKRFYHQRKKQFPESGQYKPFAIQESEPLTLPDSYKSNWRTETYLFTEFVGVIVFRCNNCSKEYVANTESIKAGCILECCDDQKIYKPGSQVKMTIIRIGS